MDAQPDPTTPGEEKDSFNWRVFILWPFVLLLLYILSIGPVAVLFARGKLSPAIEDKIKVLYFSLLWAYYETPLHKPLGIYFHLWDPKDFDKNGEEIIRARR